MTSTALVTGQMITMKATKIIDESDGVKSSVKLVKGIFITFLPIKSKVI